MKFITVGHSMGTNMPVLLYFSLWFQESLFLQRRGEEKKGLEALPEEIWIQLNLNFT